MIEQFVEYLQSRSVSEEAKSIYRRFRKVVRYAIDREVMLKAPVRVWYARWMSKFCVKMYYQ